MTRTLPKSPHWVEPALPFPEEFKCQVLGEMPRPQGSLRHVGGGRLIYGDELIMWRQLLQARFVEALPHDWTPIDDACHLDVVFAFHPPKSTPKWREDFPLKGTGSDLDKLVRAVGDALEQSGVVENDSRIASITAVKGFAPLVLADIGCEVRVSEHDLPTR